jgi:hypothetical protein
LALGEVGGNSFSYVTPLFTALDPTGYPVAEDHGAGGVTVINAASLLSNNIETIVSIMLSGAAFTRRGSTTALTNLFTLVLSSPNPNGVLAKNAKSLSLGKSFILPIMFGMILCIYNDSYNALETIDMPI